MTLTLKRNGAIPDNRHPRRRPKDLLGQRFERWAVVAEAGFVNGSTNMHWICRCDCGAEGVVRGSQLTSGGSKSCGCLTREVNAARETSHGKSKSQEFKAWQAMHQRCSNAKCGHFHSYGGRGVTVCERWNSFDNFYADMGNAPSSRHSLDRINNSGNYGPDNCRWATSKVQANNRRNTLWIQWKGRQMCAADWSKEINISAAILRKRIKILHWPIERAMSEPIRNW